MKYIHNLFSYLRLRQTFNHPFTWLVLIPWFLFCIYMLGFKTPQYESTTSLVFRNSPGDTVDNTWLRFLRPKKVEDLSDKTNIIYLIQKYLYSKTILNKIDLKLNLIDHYKSADIDFLSRLKINATADDCLNYYQKKISSSFDRNTNELIIKAKTFSPQMSSQLIKIIEEETASFYNDINNKFKTQQQRILVQALKNARSDLLKMYRTEKEAHSITLNNPKNIHEHEMKNMQIKIATSEYESILNAYLKWQLTTENNTPLVTSGVLQTEQRHYPSLPYDLISALATLLAIYFLFKAAYIIIMEHVA